jgi:hypothetical protein
MVHIIVLILALHSDAIIGKAALTEKTFNKVADCNEYIESPRFATELLMLQRMVEPRFELPMRLAPLCVGGIDT